MNETSLLEVPSADAGGDTSTHIAALAPWSQNILLPDGSQTAPQEPLAEQAQATWEEFRDFLPHDLTGCTVLDIGCNAGYFAIELAKRGADVNAVDCEPHALRQAQWAIAQHGLEDRITLYQGRIYDLAAWKQQHDVVLLLGHLERLRYPLLALDLVSRLVKRCLVLRSPMIQRDEVEISREDLPADSLDVLARPGWPKLAFIEKSFAGDPSRRWVPNRAGLEAMLRSSGLDIVARPGEEIYICQARGATEALRDQDDELAAATGAGAREPSRYGESARFVETSNEPQLPVDELPPAITAA
jgi:tRNA (mo5U34)-methyltransferase